MPSTEAGATREEALSPDANGGDGRQPTTLWAALVELLQLAWPIALMNVLGVVTVGVDTAMVGHLPDATHALAAMAFAGDIVMVLTAAMIGMSVATAALVSQAHGAGDRPGVARLGGRTTQATVGLGLVVAVLGPALAPLALSVLGADAASAALAMAYLRPLLLGAPLTFAVMHFAAVYRALGRTLPPLGFALAMNALNVVLDAGLIFGAGGMPALGVAGAAVGTLAAQGLAATGMALHLARMGAIDGLELRRRPDPGFLARAGAIGVPVALDVLVVSAGFFGLLAVLGRMSTEAVAAHTIGLRVQLLALMPGLGLSAATAALVGQALGARQVREVEVRARAAMAASALGMGALGLVVVGLRPWILAGFGLAPGQTTSGLAADWMVLLALTLPFAGVYHAIEGVFHGAGVTRVPTGINLVAIVGFMVPAAVLLAAGLGLGPHAVWATFPLAYALKAALAAGAYRQGRWAGDPRRG